MTVRQPAIAPQGFRPVPRTGVIYVMTEAARHGYSPAKSEWSNLGQGAPETGEIPNAPKRIDTFQITNDDHEYAPIDGIPKLRQAVADLYNARYRKGLKSQYTAENVAISSGGRAGLTRVVSTLGRTNVGHFLPDYTAYEELLDAFGAFVSIPVLLEQEVAYEFSPDQLQREILGRGLSAVLLSNPANPTGQVIRGERLEKWVHIARELGCTLILDEFYSHYIYDGEEPSISAAKYVEDVNRDPVILVDGLTKNWRYPGWRVSWTIAPKPMIEAIASAGSFLDGGCARPMQIAALQLVNQSVADQEAKAIQKHFKKKRDVMLNGLESLGIRVQPAPVGSFYCWGDLSGLPESINTGMTFFKKALEQKVIIVPGEFFDINPGQRRPDRPSRFRHFARFSFGPSEETIERAMSALKEVVRG